MKTRKYRSRSISPPPKSRRDKWKRRLRKVATPTLTAGALTGVGVVSTIIAGGKEALNAGPEAIEDFADVISEVGSGLPAVLSNSFNLLSTLIRLGVKGLEFLTRN